MQGGQDIGDDLGFGPGQAFLSSEIEKIANLPQGALANEPRSFFDPTAMKNVYPDIWDRTSESPFGFLGSNFEAIRSFVVDSVGSALIS